MILEIVKRRIDVPGLVTDIIDEVLEPALDKLVKSTDTTLDDALKAALYPLLSALMKEEAAKLWAKVLPDAEAPTA